MDKKDKAKQVIESAKVLFPFKLHVKYHQSPIRPKQP